MVEINGKEIRLRYTVKTHLAFLEWVEANEKASMDAGYLHIIPIMSESYAKANGGDVLTAEDIEEMDYSDFVALKEEARIVMSLDSRQQIETKEPKGKNAGSAAGQN